MKLWKIFGACSRCFCPLNWPFFRGGAFSQNWGAGPSILGKGRWPVNYKWFVIERLTFEPNFLIWFKKYRSPRLLLHSLLAAHQQIKTNTHTQIQKYQIHNHEKIRMQKVKCSSSAHQLLGDKVAFMIRWYLGFQRSVLGFKKKEIHQNLILEMMGQ